MLEIFLLLVAILILIIVAFYVFKGDTYNFNRELRDNWKQPNINYEIIGRGDPQEVQNIIDEQLADTPLEHHFIRGQAMEHVIQDPVAAAQEYAIVLNLFAGPDEEDFINVLQHATIDIDTILNRIEDFPFIQFDVNEVRFNTEPQDPFDVKVHSDPQNVHDSNVTEAIRKKYEAIKELNGPPIFTVADVIEGTKDMPNRDNILKVLDVITSTYIPITKLNDTETNILLNVYQRIHDPDNNPNYDSLIASFYDALRDCYEEDKDFVVCPVGRVTRIISCLTLLDTNDDLSNSTKTDEILKLEFMGKANHILNDLIDNLSESDKKKYDQNDPSIDDNLKDKLSESLRDEYKDIINKDKLDNLVRQAILGI